MKIHVTNLRAGMTVTIKNWCGTHTAEVIKVENRGSGFMIQTTKGPFSLDANEEVVLVRS